MKRSEKSRILIIAGANGAGKTTFAEEFLPNEADCPIFVNADFIAAGLAPFDPDRTAMKAGRLMLAEIYDHVRRHESFTFTTPVLIEEGENPRAQGKLMFPKDKRNAIPKPFCS
jgi:predicted ABC-type ATPase